MMRQSAPWEAAGMATNVVNLDALIPREDLAAAGAQSQVSKQDRIDIHHLDDHFFAGALRKPDFQRETAHWSPEKVADLVHAFIDGDLIPAVILWQRGNNVFVIDGAHRLGALLAWVQDDYGDGRRSLEYFGGRIPDEQLKIADRTRKLIRADIGPYGEYAAARKNPSNAQQRIQSRLSNLSINSLIAQWVPAVDEKAAEDSFFKINQAATPIDATERRILKSRNAPNAVSARAIVRGGTGHKYWSNYRDDVRLEIEALGKQINAALYEPPIGDLPIKTMDLPVAGRGYNALPFIFDLVNWANAVPDPSRKKGEDIGLPPDSDGSHTIAYLTNVQKIVDQITGTKPVSLGLHPVVYFYTRGGEFQPNAFLATAELVKALTSQGRLSDFTTIRRKFEDFLIGHKEAVTLTIKHAGAGRRSLNRIVRYYDYVIQRITEGRDSAAIETALQNDQEFSYLIGRAPPKESESGSPRRFTRNTKTASFLDVALQSVIRCGICRAMVHKNSMHFDHIQPIRDGGISLPTNAQVTHPFCNSGIKS